jgi:hypothetical protein
MSAGRKFAIVLLSVAMVWSLAMLLIHATGQTLIFMAVYFMWNITGGIMKILKLLRDAFLTASAVTVVFGIVFYLAFVQLPRLVSWLWLQGDKMGADLAYGFLGCLFIAILLGYFVGNIIGD